MLYDMVIKNLLIRKSTICSKNMSAGMNSQAIHAIPLKKNAALCETRLSTLFMITPDNMKAGISTALLRMKFKYLLPTNSTEFIDSP